MQCAGTILDCSDLGDVSRLESNSQFLEPNELSQQLQFQLQTKCNDSSSDTYEYEAMKRLINKSIPIPPCIYSWTMDYLMGFRPIIIVALLATHLHDSDIQDRK